jgi:large subunit ribosomal protein L2
VRGIAMNPIDHPHGGRTDGGRPSCTPWGVYCKGTRTRRRNKESNEWIVERKGGQPIQKFYLAKKVAKREAARS